MLHTLEPEFATSGQDMGAFMSNGRLRGKRILVAEDSWHVAAALSAMLQAEGARILGPAASLAKAVQLVADDPPDLAVIDLDLRGEPAWVLLQELQVLGVGTVVLSGHLAELSSDAEGKCDFVTEWLSKPADPSRIVGALSSAAQTV